MDERKSMNTHLHLLEAYAALLAVYDDERLRRRLRELIEIFLGRILDARSHHFLLFFDDLWAPRSRKISFGHDIEGSWLLCEAAQVLGDQPLLEQVRAAALHMAGATLAQGIDREGGLMYEAERGAIVDSDRHWWPQAEAVVGFLNAYQLSGEELYLRASRRSWAFIESHIVDRERGEWFWLVRQDGSTDPERDKAGPWKCPYHNARACLEALHRLGTLFPEKQRCVEAHGR
jgi:mannobiose 2-epimerase